MKKKVLVTGSSRGIGLAIALKLLEEGNNVLINGRNRDTLVKIKKKYKNIKYVIGDFSSPNQSNKAIRNAVKILGGLDVLICNIGESKSCKPNEEDYTEWRKMFNQNFFTATNAIENSKKELIKSKGVIICISSGAGNKFVKGAPITYSTAKAALTFYAKSLAYYLGSYGVRLNIIAPGNTLFKGSTWEKKIKKNKKQVRRLIKETVPLNRFGKTEEIADMASYLISNKAKFINGAVFTIDGGQTI
jgi:3-oxoacyl-[acyl-carrier protein] reductase